MLGFITKLSSGPKPHFPQILGTGFFVDSSELGSGVPEWKVVESQEAHFAYSMNTNISIAEPAHIIKKALDEFRKTQPITTENLPTLAALQERYSKPDESTGLSWESWVEWKPRS